MGRNLLFISHVFTAHGPITKKHANLHVDGKKKKKKRTTSQYILKHEIKNKNKEINKFIGTLLLDD